MKKARLLWIGLVLMVMLSACTAPAATDVPAAYPAAAEVAETSQLSSAYPVATKAQSVDPVESPVTLTVLAAASLTESFTEIGAAFEAAHPGVTVEFNFAGSQQLAEQLVAGAPADVFASANNKQMSVAIEGGRVQEGAPMLFVQNRLVVIVPANNPAGIATLADLAKSRIMLDLAAEEVPVGKYSLEFLDKASADPSFGSDFAAKVLANVVSYEENVKAVLNKVSLGEADAGIVYTTDAFTVTGQVGQIEIPVDLNVLADYPIAVVADSANADLAQAFVDFVLSDEGQAVMQKCGFMPTR